MAEDVARLGFEIDSTQALSAARNLLTMEQAAGKAEVAGAKLQRVFRNAKGQFADAADGARLHKREIEQLAAKYNTALSAELAFANAQKEVARAVQLGVLSTGQAEAALEQLQAQYVQTNTTMRAMGNAQASVGNQFAQMNDVVVTSIGGMNPLLIGMQQGMQVVQGMAGQTLPQAARTLGGAFMTLLSPTTLVTVGLIAGGAALIQWGMAALGASEDARSYEDAIGDLESAVSDVNAASRLFGAGGAEEILQIYGRMNIELRQHLAIMDELAQRNALAQMAAPLTAAVGEMTGVFTTATSAMQSLFSPGNIGQANAMVRAIQQIEQASDIDSSLLSYERLLQMIESATGGIENMSDEQRAFYTRVREAYNAVLELRGASTRTGWFADAIARARELRDLVVEATAAANLDAAGNVTQFAPGSLARTAPRRAPSTDELLTPSRGASSAANERANQLQQFIEELRTEQETLEAWRTEQLDLLAQYNNAELEAIGGHNEARLRIEQEYADRMREIHDAERQERLSGYSTMFGNLASLMNTESKKLFRIGQAAAIANAVMEGWESAVSAWRWGMKFGGPPLAAAASAASLAKTGAMIASIASQKPNGSGSSSSGSSSIGTTSSTVSQSSDRRVLVTFDGPDWAKDMFESWTDQLFDAAGDGKVIFT